MESNFKREFSPVIEVNFQPKSKVKQTNKTMMEEIKRIDRLLINKYARTYLAFSWERNQRNHYTDVHFKSCLPLSSVKKHFVHWTYKEGIKGNANNSIKQIDRNTYSIRLYIDWHDDSIMFLYQSEGR